jgi:methyl-accepting chemotaxis protein
MRLMGAMRGLTKNVMASAVETASENIDRMQQEAGDAMNRASDAMNQTGEQAGHMVQQANEQMGNIIQDANNNYVQH